jgi:cobalt-zinc-cadmium resistance protein CzcA
MALIGGVFALYLTGTPFSVSAAIGIIGLFGISVMEGIIVLTYFNQKLETGLERSQAILNACHTRLRPVMMTCSAACVRAVAGSLFQRDRFAGAKTARAGCGGRYPAGTGAGADHLVFVE